MNKDTLSKCIILTGPSSVGKSFISKNLSKKLNYPVVSMDDLLNYIIDEMDGELSLSKKKIKRYVIDYYSEFNDDLEEFEQKGRQDLIDKQTELLDEYLDEFVKYRKILGQFKKFYPAVNKYLTLQDVETDDPKNIIYWGALVSSEMLEKIIKKINYPIIIDTPAWLGWHTKKLEMNDECIEALSAAGYSLDLKKAKRIIRKVLRTGVTVYLEPGLDYEDRNAAKNSGFNNEILKKVDDYQDEADVMISVNSLFNDSKDESLKNRTYFNAEVNLQQDKIKNNGEISNICDQIIEKYNEIIQARENELTC